MFRNWKFNSYICTLLCNAFYAYIGISHWIDCCCDRSSDGGGNNLTLTVISIGKFNLSILHKTKLKIMKWERKWCEQKQTCHTYIQSMHSIWPIYFCVLWNPFFVVSELNIATHTKKSIFSIVYVQRPYQIENMLSFVHICSKLNPQKKWV